MISKTVLACNSTSTQGLLESPEYFFAYRISPSFTVKCNYQRLLSHRLFIAVIPFHCRASSETINGNGIMFGMTEVYLEIDVKLVSWQLQTGEIVFNAEGSSTVALYI